MLKRLHIYNILLIQDISLSFEKEGFTSFTGETGSGKSILLDCISLLFGRKGGGSYIREGCEEAFIFASFNIPPSPFFQKVKDLLKLENIILQDQDNNIDIKRYFYKPNKSKITINNKVVNLSFIKELSSFLIHIHGQFDTLFLPERHLLLLDTFTQHCFLEFADYLEKTKLLFKRKEEIKKYLNIEKRQQEKNHSLLSYYQEIVKELEQVNPKIKEEEILLEERKKLSGGNKIAEGISIAEKGFSHPLDIIHHLSIIYRELSRKVSGIKEAEKFLSSLDRALIELSDFQEEIEFIKRDLSDIPGKITQIEDRLYLLRSVARKYNLHPFELYEKKEEFKKLLENFASSGESLKKLENDLEEVEKDFEEHCLTLHNFRQQSAKRLEKAIKKELEDLQLPDAEFFVHFSQPQAPSVEGNDEISFYVITNKNYAPSPLHKIASGGEMARFTLALQVVFSSSQRFSTLILDEVDTGLGGSVAFAVGKKLKKLGQVLQVLAITHSPQVAAFSKNHFLVLKKDYHDEIVTIVERLEGERKEKELARMLSGSKITNEALIAANKLLEDSQKS